MNLNVDALVDIEYNRDLDDLTEEFKDVKVSDNASLRLWFDKHPYLTVHDMARIAGVCHKTVYTWRKRAKWLPPIWMRQTKVAKPPKPIPRRAKTPKAPPNWTTAWLVAAYQSGHSLPQLARATRRSETAIKKRLKRHVTLRDNKDSVRTDHPCCALAWVFDHYVRQKLSKARCARLAGVSRYTFTVWLDYFKIRARSNSEQLLVQHGTDMGALSVPQAKRNRTG